MYQTDSSETPPTVNELYLHLHTVNHDGMTFIDTRSKRFYDRFQRRRLELTQATPDQPVDDEAVYLNVAGECPKGRVYGLGSLRRKKRRYADPGASTSQMPEMVPRAEFDIVVEQLRKVMAFMHQHLGMTMDGAGPSQAQLPPPPPPPHDQQQPPQIDPADQPQQGDNIDTSFCFIGLLFRILKIPFSPIRITAINGDIELVRELLKIDSSLCSLKDRDERTPIHLAAMKGRLDVMGELLSACPESAGEELNLGLLCNNLEKQSLFLLDALIKFEILSNGSETECIISVSVPLLIRDGSETEYNNSVSDPSLISNGTETEIMHSVSDPFLIRDGSKTECRNSVFDPFLISNGSETELMHSVSDPFLIRDGMQKLRL
ncbi:hypothetical protein Scep_021889 [Stephania cephalantha]|uniref:Uncharacterized protein n=1 Tax=Stephania cephalantha TaxID=152367 RepID=A0AAP0I1T7_9MAGN